MSLCRIIYRQFALIGRFCHKLLIQVIPAGADIRTCEIAKSACLRSQIAVFHAAADIEQFIVGPVRKLKPKTGHISSVTAIIYRLIFERQTFQPLVQRFDIIFFCNDFLLCRYRNALEMIHLQHFPHSSAVNGKSSLTVFPLQPINPVMKISKTIKPAAFFHFITLLYKKLLSLYIVDNEGIRRAVRQIGTEYDSRTVLAVTLERGLFSASASDR